ncbi:hypothetical protein [Cognatiyoonia sp. IB215182]|uniref:VpaChn25_0724 family phage protein n=1 Tax=Cognatiyoonia sp. IB215182 TaxID=3097353 RepID=UPI002A159DA7|nr:hypothetical protein [Cognatiyoonia sp. IB215182]MDX8354339.1 hypothetical protein [Cognatiyoonia sp. IB215182]
MDMDQIIREDARLIVLKALAAEDTETLNSGNLLPIVKSFGIRKDRAWLHGELDYLKDMGAITLIEANSVKVAILTEKGHRHLMREIQIEGVKRPSRPGG